MRTTEQLLTRALFVLFPIYTIVMLFPYESSLYSSWDLQQLGKQQIRILECSLVRRQKGYTKIQAPGKERRKAQFHSEPFPASLDHSVSDQRT